MFSTRSSSSSSKSSVSRSDHHNDNRDRETRSSGSRSKRDKPSTGTDNSSSRDKEKDVFEPRKTRRELYETSSEHENIEAKSLDIDAHLESSLQICRKIEQIMDDLYEAKLQGSTNSTAFNEKKMECSMLLTTIKRMNRLYKLRLRNAKGAILDQRRKVDADHLRLQNLIYEATHLSDQVSAVQDYKGIDEDIELIPIQQFYAEAPESISKVGTTTNDSHLLRVARLEYEYKQRQNLTDKCKELEKAKEKVSEEIAERQTKLSSIAPLLAKILEVTKPLEEFFDLDITEKETMAEHAKFLPTPLYILYVSSAGYAETLEGEYIFKVCITGDIVAAQQMEKLAKTGGTKETDEISPMEIDDEEVAEKDMEEEEEEVSKRRKLRKHSSIQEEKIDVRTKILQKHPLNIEWTLSIPGGENLVLKFYYLTRFRIVTVVANLNLKNLSPKLSKMLSKSDNILCDLWPNDDGEESPNPSSIFILESADVERFGELVSEIGRPYKWVQRIAGLIFLPEDNEQVSVPTAASSKVRSISKFKISAANVPGTLQLLQDRLSNRMYLSSALKILETGTISLPPLVAESFPTKDSGGFTSWEPMEFSEFQAFHCTRDPISEKVVSPSDMFLKFVVEREKKKLIALISIQHDYPEAAPTTILFLKEAEEQKDELYGRSLRGIEKEINCDIPMAFLPWKEEMLPIQLRILIDRMDNVPLDFDEIIEYLKRRALALHEGRFAR